MSEVTLVAVTQPVIDGISTAEEFVAYAARVSNPTAQINNETAPRLLSYLLKNKHFSPFEMVDVCLEIKTTRDIGRQILRHRSFVFQEFSQRYAAVTDGFEIREARLQDTKNRQNSIDIDDEELQNAWKVMQNDVAAICESHYKNALQLGIAKEQARAVLPEGMTKTTMYVKGSLRSWIHYCQLRCGNGTQKEHREVAEKCWEIISKEFPSIADLVADDHK
jgi:thymidylate synthase (FAD)